MRARTWQLGKQFGWPRVSTASRAIVSLYLMECVLCPACLAAPVSTMYDPYENANRTIGDSSIALTSPADSQSQEKFWNWAKTPPMGWNSWDCFATTVNETQVKAQADYMAKHLARYGWQYIVVDIQWYEPEATGFNYRAGAPLVIDLWSRLQPAPNKFPSASSGTGFKALADYVHSKGLKFGIHMMRGIPRLAVTRNSAVQRQL